MVCCRRLVLASYLALIGLSSSTNRWHAGCVGAYVLPERVSRRHFGLVGLLRYSSAFTHYASLISPETFDLIWCYSGSAPILAFDKTEGQGAKHAGTESYWAVVSADTTEVRFGLVWQIKSINLLRVTGVRIRSGVLGQPAQGLEHVIAMGQHVGWALEPFIYFPHVQTSAERG